MESRLRQHPVSYFDYVLGPPPGESVLYVCRLQTTVTGEDDADDWAASSFWEFCLQSATEDPHKLKTLLKPSSQDFHCMEPPLLTFEAKLSNNINTPTSPRIMMISQRAILSVVARTGSRSVVSGTQQRMFSQHCVAAQKLRVAFEEYRQEKYVHVISTAWSAHRCFLSN